MAKARKRKCKYGVSKGGPTKGNCLKHPRVKKGQGSVKMRNYRAAMKKARTKARSYKGKWAAVCAGRGWRGFGHGPRCRSTATGQWVIRDYCAKTTKCRTSAVKRKRR